MLHDLLVKFSLVFILGVITTIGLAYVLVPETPKLVSDNVLGDRTEETDKVKSFVQSALDDVVEHISKSPALTPLFETKQSIETTVSEVQALPDAQKSAICMEICPDPNAKLPSQIKN